MIISSQGGDCSHPNNSTLQKAILTCVLGRSPSRSMKAMGVTQKSPFDL